MNQCYAIKKPAGSRPLVLLDSSVQAKDEHELFMTTTACELDRRHYAALMISNPSKVANF
jgi:hypothetical protein